MKDVSDEELSSIERALEGADVLDVELLERVLAELKRRRAAVSVPERAVRLDERMQCAAALSELSREYEARAARAVIGSASKAAKELSVQDTFEAAGLMHGAMKLLEPTGMHMPECPECARTTRHKEDCVLGMVSTRYAARLTGAPVRKGN